MTAKSASPSFISVNCSLIFTHVIARRLTASIVKSCPLVLNTYARPPLERSTLVSLPISSICFPLLARKRSEEHTSELQSRGHLVCRLLLEKNKHNQR